MKKEEDIFNIFREDQGKLDERPSARAWNRLEKKLDARHTKQKKIFYFQAFVAASLALILAMVTAVSVFNTNSENTAMSIINDEEDGMTLTATTDGEIAVRDYHEPLIMTHNEQKVYVENDSKFQQLSKNRIAENKLDPNKKFKSKFDNLSPGRQDSLQLAQVIPSENANYGLTIPLPEKNEPKPSLGISDGGTSKKSDIKSKLGEGIIEVVDEEVSKNKPAEDNIPADIEAEEAFLFDDVEPVEKPEITEADVESIARKDLPEMRSKDQQGLTETQPGTYNNHAENLEKERTAGFIDSRKEESIVQADRKAASKKQKSNAKTQLKSPALADKAEPNKAEEEVESKMELAESPMPTAPSNTMDIDASKNDISYEFLGNAVPSQNIRLFEWLIGEWVDDNGQSAETWTRKDDLTITGKGSFMVNGNIIFTESMRISKIDDHLYFIVAVDSTNTENYYRLVRYDNSEAVFENANLNFPNQVIIQRNSDDNFSTIMQNNAPAQIKETQQGYLQNRNQITNERAFRNLKRAND